MTTTPDALKDLKVLINSFHPILVIPTVEEDRVKDLVYKAAHELNLPFYDWSIATGFRTTDILAPADTEDPVAALTYMQSINKDAVFLLKDFVQHLNNPKIIRQFRELAQKLNRSKSMMVLVAPSAELPAEIQHKAVSYDLPFPTRDELKATIKSVLAELGNQNRAANLKLNLTPEEGDNLLNALMGMTVKQVRQTIAYCVMEDNFLDAKDLTRVLARKAQAIREDGILDFYPAQANSFEIGGFANLKAFLNKLHMGFSKEAASMGIKPPRGILIVGVPGCGKSLAAKAIARLWRMPLLKLDAGRLFDKYVGESEKNFKRAILSAEAMAPSVLWIDEIEKAIAVTQGSDADGGLSKRLFGAFLTWLQEKSKPVFVVATANDLSQLPPELLRKGRFDEVFFVDLPTEQERVEIFGIHFKLKKLDPSRLDIQKLSQSSQGFSGSEIEQVVTSAVLRSLHEKRPVDSQMVIEEIQATVPLSQSRAADIQRIREMGASQFVSVN